MDFIFSYQGSDTDKHQIDFYDVAQGLMGFQRSLALTTHLILNGKVITQAPSLKNAQIVVRPPEEGSWEICATILGGMFFLGTAPKHTPIGHLIYSAYDYIIAESLGFHVNYEETLGQQYERIKKYESNIPILDQGRFDSVIEKCENSIIEMHRPIYASGSATHASISGIFNGVRTPLKSSFTLDSYSYIHDTVTENFATEYTGRVSMYNANTFKGRLYIDNQKRPVPFILDESARTPRDQIKLADSLAANVKSRFSSGDVTIKGYRLLSKMGHLKAIKIVHVE